MVFSTLNQTNDSRMELIDGVWQRCLTRNTHALLTRVATWNMAHHDGYDLGWQPRFVSFSECRKTFFLGARTRRSPILGPPNDPPVLCGTALRSQPILPSSTIFVETIVTAHVQCGWYLFHTHTHRRPIPKEWVRQECPTIQHERRPTRNRNTTNL